MMEKHKIRQQSLSKSIESLGHRASRQDLNSEQSLRQEIAKSVLHKTIYPPIKQKSVAQIIQDQRRASVVKRKTQMHKQLTKEMT